MHTEEIKFSTDTQCLAATKIYPINRQEPTILTLHGLGITASRHGIRYVLNHLADHGHSSMCFDFSGNGDSTGLLEESCLNRRREEALAAAQQLNKNTPPILIGTSMGGHIATWISSVVHPRGLILFCPATYSANAANLKFNSTFERPNNYIDSPAYASMRKFTGDLLIIAAKKDTVVPANVIEDYLANAQNVRSKKIIWLDDSDHYIHSWLPYQKAKKHEVLNEILKLISVCTHSK